MIHVIATIEVAPGQREAFLAAFHQLVPHVHAEAGCVEYGPTIDVATEIAAHPPRDNAVVVVEKWESLETLKSHLGAPHMLEFRKAHGHLIQQTKIQVLETA